MRRIGLLVGVLAAAVLMTGATALAGKPGNSLNAKSCQKDGWKNLYTRSGQSFTNGGSCTSYAAKGGQLIVAAALACLDDGWKSLGPTPTQVFASEQACVDFANSGGVPVAASADLALTKSVSDATPNVGDTITFTVTISNSGPATATNVAVHDQLPTGLTFLAATPSQGTYNSASGLWAVGTVSAGTTQTLQIIATVDSPLSATNTASINHSDQPDLNPANNSASATETPQQADLALNKTVDNPTPNVGANVVFTITLSNSGPDTATNVAVLDQLPTGLTFLAATPSQGTYNSANGLWTVGTVSTVTPQTLTIIATVTTAATTTNTASVNHTDQFDPNTANNSASASVTPPADLALTKSVSDATPNVGDTITFTVTISNSGPATATNVAVHDQLPTGLTFLAATPSQGTYNSASGLWAVGTVSAGTTQTLQIIATVDSPLSATNTASINHSDQPDLNPANNSASATETPQQADLALNKTVDNPTPNVGANVVFTITLSNSGPDTATNVAVLDQLPTGLTFLAATPSQGTYNSANGLWTVGTVSTVTPQTLTIIATVTTAATTTNTASVNHTDQFDPNTANNSASATVN